MIVPLTMWHVFKALMAGHV